MMSMTIIPEPFKKRVFYSKTEEVLHIILYLNSNNGCTASEIREIFTGCDAQVSVLLKRLNSDLRISYFKHKKDYRKDLYWVTDKGLKYLERKKITLEFDL